ncbi:hypothetical protein IQ07DRAFT_317344 [Pyrenochaeta sp. DS3sAY3a]|nr:hypothetical protein IQ07DRAFT_317344 [Pyrenochaeta sp. DS3sAY3a]
MRCIRIIFGSSKMSHSTTTDLRHGRNDIPWTALPEIDCSTSFDSETWRQEGVEETDTLLSEPDLQTTHPHNLEAAAPSSPAQAEFEANSETNDNHACNEALLSNNGETVEEVELSVQQPSSQHFSPDRPKLPTNWLPYTLQPLFLGILAVCSLALTIVTAVLCWYSTRNNGLGRDDGSKGLIVAWKYVPTAIAVFFAQAMVMILNDVNRTEPFAKLAFPRPVAATFTLLYSPKNWWNTLSDCRAQKKRLGRTPWMPLLSTIFMGLSALVISPLSSSFLVAEEVVIQNQVPMQRHVFDSSQTMQLMPERDTYLHTMSGYLYNTSASQWISDTHIVLPFGLEPSPDTDGLSRQETWQAETTVMQLESQCTSMSVAQMPAANISYALGREVYVTPSILRNIPGDTFMKCDDLIELMKSDTTFSSDLNATQTPVTCKTDYVGSSLGLEISSKDGCTIQLRSPFLVLPLIIEPVVIELPFSLEMSQVQRMMWSGGAIWTNISASYSSWQDLIREYGDSPYTRMEDDIVGSYDEWESVGTYIYDVSDKCRGRDLLFVTSPWYGEDFDFSPNFTAQAEICTPTYYAATMPVTQSISGVKSSIKFDQSEFMNRRVALSEEIFDIETLNHLAFRDRWDRYTAAPANAELQGLRGASRVISELFRKGASLDDSRSDASFVLRNDSVSDQATRLRSRFFGELILNSITNRIPAGTETVTGQVERIEKRIIVIPEVAIPLSVFFGISTIYVAFLLKFVSIKHRPLGLRKDPATTAGIALLLRLDSSLAMTLRSLRNSPAMDIYRFIRSRFYSLRNGILGESKVTISDSTGNIKTQQTRLDWRPSMLIKRFLAAYLLGLALVAVALLVLQRFASQGRLTRSFFVSEVDWKLFHTSISPASIITTLVAVIISLTWDGIDKPMRTLQPYLAMSKRSSYISEGVNLSYQSVYWAWAATKAAFQKHWILVLITTGTTLCQILVVSLAAIFETHTVIKMQESSVNNAYIFRQQPFQFSSSVSNWFYLTDDILNTTKTDWMNNALDEIALGTAAPIWTKDEWAFTPLALETLSAFDPSKSNHTTPNTLDKIIETSANVSLKTTGMRARLDCSLLPLGNTSFTTSIRDEYESERIGDLTGLVLRPSLKLSQLNNTPIYSARRQMSCCESETAGRNAVIAYWSSNNSYADERNVWPDSLDGSGWVQNFTVKVIAGQAKTAEVSGLRDLSNEVMSFTPDGRRQNGNVSLLYFERDPQMQILNCGPIIEIAEALITVEHSTGQVLESTIVEQPRPALGLWDQAFALGNASIECSLGCLANGTVSYGNYFLAQMLTAAHIIDPPATASDFEQYKDLENVKSERFNIRDTKKGLNMDFMSYANYVLANQNHTALFDVETLCKYSERTFQTFFKHFMASARWGDERAVYERIDPQNAESTKVTVSTRTKSLGMSKTATWLSLAIIFLLIIILIVLMISLEIVYPKTSMQRNIDCIADVLLMVAGSDDLVTFIHENDERVLKKSTAKTRLGWFRDKRGVVRWGVEFEDEVEWVDNPGNEFTGHLAQTVIQSLKKGHGSEVTDSGESLVTC